MIVMSMNMKRKMKVDDDFTIVGVGNLQTANKIKELFFCCVIIVMDPSLIDVNKTILKTY